MSAKSESIAISIVSRTARRRVVDDVEVLVDALVDGPVEPDRERLAVDRADVVEERLVRVLEAGREELDRRGVQEERPVAVDPEVVARRSAACRG